MAKKDNLFSATHKKNTSLELHCVLASYLKIRFTWNLKIFLFFFNLKFMLIKNSVSIIAPNLNIRFRKCLPKRKKETGDVIVN